MKLRNSIRSFLLSLCLCTSYEISAQNLVPNPSFEDYTTCPPYFGLANFATGWLNLYTQSADYFNSCNTNGVVDVPSNQFGYQYAFDGEGYVGMATYAFNRPKYREMVGVQLLQPLQVGVPVCLSFKVAVGGFGTVPANSAGYTCKGIGMKFFNSLPFDSLNYLYPNSAALYLDFVPSDTAIWYRLEGQYVPDSAYNFLAIGNFFADSLLDITIQDSIGPNATDWAYVFVDDIRVSYDLDFCVIDLGLTSINRDYPKIYPIPFSELLAVEFPKNIQDQVHYSLYDLYGRMVLEGAAFISNGLIHIPGNGLNSGCFVLKLITKQQKWKPITVVHVSP